MLIFEQFMNQAFGENTYVVWDDQSMNATVIDPGMMTQIERDKVGNFIDGKGLILCFVLLTHAHVDHACGAHWLSSKYGVKVMGSFADQKMASALDTQARMFGLPFVFEPLKIDCDLVDGEKLFLGNYDLVVRTTPGHSPGGVIFYVETLNMAFVGDTIFYGSVGRTDLAGGDMNQLISSIKNKVLSLPDNTKLMCGHGPSTHVSFERNNNPYL